MCFDHGSCRDPEPTLYNVPTFVVLNMASGIFWVPNVLRSLFYEYFEKFAMETALLTVASVVFWALLQRAQGSRFLLTARAHDDDLPQQLDGELQAGPGLIISVPIYIYLYIYIPKHRVLHTDV